MVTTIEKLRIYTENVQPGVINPIAEKVNEIVEAVNQLIKSQDNQENPQCEHPVDGDYVCELCNP